MSEKHELSLGPTALLLGAGFSVDMGLPVVSDLTKEVYWSIMRPQLRSIRPYDHAVRANISESYQKLYREVYHQQPGNYEAQIGILEQLEFLVEEKGDMLEARLAGLPSTILVEKLDMLGRLLGATKLMDMVLEDEHMVTKSVAEFFAGRYSFSQEG